jgi:hypothetical protein
MVIKVFVLNGEHFPEQFRVVVFERYWDVLKQIAFAKGRFEEETDGLDLGSLGLDEENVAVDGAAITVSVETSGGKKDVGHAFAGLFIIVLARGGSLDSDGTRGKLVGKGCRGS